MRNADNFIVKSGLSKGDWKGFVRIFLDGRVILCVPPKEARNIALGIMQAAEAAETDEAFAYLVLKHCKGTEQDLAGMLDDFRKCRDITEGVNNEQQGGDSGAGEPTTGEGTRESG